MLIRTGMLCLPVWDEEAAAAVRRLLAEDVTGCVVLVEQAAPMQRLVVEETLRRWCDEEELDLVLTIGGTAPAPGPSQWEIAPDATLAVADRQLPGLPEAMRAYAQEELPLAPIDRSTAVIRGRSLILNLPTGAQAAALFLMAVSDLLGAVVAQLRG